VDSVEVWRGAFGDDDPPFGPLPGVRSGNVVAYEFALSDRFRPWPGQTLLERAFILTDVGVGLSFPPWQFVITDDGGLTPGVDADRPEGATWYVDLLHVADNGSEVMVRDLYIDLMVPIDGRHQRMLDLDEFADAIEAGDLPIAVAVDGLRRWQRFLDTYVHRDRDPRATWTNFPPAQIAELAALAAPLGPVVTTP
jgi:Protein of unknown function (DUF402)